MGGEGRNNNIGEVHTGIIDCQCPSYPRGFNFQIDYYGPYMYD